MKIAVVGTGAVGQVMSKRLSELGHRVFMGTRNVEQSRKRKESDAWGTPGIGSWIEDHPNIDLVTFKEAAEKGEDLLIFGISGMAALDALDQIGKDLLRDKIMIDISNPLDFSKGFPPSLSLCNTESLGEKIQNSYPDLKVVKTLNSISSPIMANPKLIEGDHVVFLCGNDLNAKAKVSTLLQSLGWKQDNIIDLGDITNARGTEMLLPLWIRLMGKYQSPMFNINVVKAPVLSPGA
ncbi:NADPH-dependent F420 reductase [Salinimicrobium xinjiangense]|uniref:NADPH-dependent F420 reductase n=1 Tax=Salinimicrobium xinjiangense TaxID=438596 RepID=UPI000420ECC8|nr:NAD(P)-binding domain-containing protein [Salinimicrobium xinjiangense]